MPPVGVGKVLGFHEECLETFLGTRDDGGVVSEEQSAKDGYQYDGKEVRFTVLLLHCY